MTSKMPFWIPARLKDEQALAGMTKKKSATMA